MVLAACCLCGFGCTRDSARSRGYRLQAARLSSDLAPVTAIADGLLDGFDPSVTPGEKMAWLRAAVCTIFFPGGQGPARAKEKAAFRSGLDSLPAELAEPSLWHAFIKAVMERRVVHHLSFDGAADDPLLSHVIAGDREGLSAALTADPQLLQRRKEGFTLLHAAADYYQEDIILGLYLPVSEATRRFDNPKPISELVQNFAVHPDIASDHGITPIELTVVAGSLEW